jgi:hypothetical protein
MSRHAGCKIVILWIISDESMPFAATYHLLVTCELVPIVNTMEHIQMVRSCAGSAIESKIIVAYHRQ